MKLTEKEIQEKIKDLEGWVYQEEGLQMTYEFEDFKDAFSAMTRIAFEAELLDHHPDWSNSYNKLYIHLTTHEEGGVTEKDFELAAIIDTVV